jgi:hypothetical protein
MISAWRKCSKNLIGVFAEQRAVTWRPQARKLSKRTDHKPSIIEAGAKHIGGSFASAFGETLAFYVVVFGGGGIAMYFLVPRIYHFAVNTFEDSTKQKLSEAKRDAIEMKDGIKRRWVEIVDAVKEKTVSASVGAKEKTTQSVKDAASAANEYAELASQQAKAKSTDMMQKGYEATAEASRNAADKAVSVAGSIRNRVTEKLFNRTKGGDEKADDDDTGSSRAEETKKNEEENATKK